MRKKIIDGSPTKRIKFNLDGQIFESESQTPPTSTKIDNVESQLEYIKEKYLEQGHSIRERNHRRTSSQLQKLDKIIKDTNDIYQILDNSNKWMDNRVANIPGLIEMTEETGERERGSGWAIGHKGQSQSVLGNRF